MQCLNPSLKMRLGTIEAIPVTFFSCWRHLPAIATLQLHPTRDARQKPLIPISNNIDQRAFRGRMWLTCFDIPWKWLSRLISIYLLSLSFAAVASDYPAPSTFPCEDISNYYSPVKRLRLRGEALKTQLNTIIAPHHSLSYREVWDALKVLDAADVDNPEASSGIVEIYSLRVVPKRLSGKPQGWNSELDLS